MTEPEFIAEDLPEEVTCPHCHHVGPPVGKYDGGKLPVLCGECYIILYYRERVRRQFNATQNPDGTFTVLGDLPE